MLETYDIIWSNYNNAKLDDFQGLTANEMDHLLRKSFSKNSIVQLKDNLTDDVLDKIPYFRLAEEFLKIIEKNRKLKLTTTGSLPVKVMEELYDKKFITDYYVEQGLWKIKREKNSDLFTTLNITVKYCDYIKKYRGELVFTKAGKEWLNEKDRNKFLRTLLKSFTEKFNWSFNDGHPNMPIGQLGWAFSIYLLFRYGQIKRPISFFSEKYFKAFPSFIANYPSISYWKPERGCHMCYSIRTVERFLEWFGLIEISDFDFPINKNDGNIQATKLLTELFIIQKGFVA